MSLDSIDELASHCIRCGFCLESCPTFQITGDESHSPRGRIYLARSASEGVLSWKDIQPALDGCLGCRACETSCPSGVEYGKLLELAREKLAKESPKHAQSGLLKVITNTQLATMQFKAAKVFRLKRTPELVGKLLSDEPQEANIPQPFQLKWPKLDKTNLPEIKGEVAILGGCVMGVLFPGTHEATQRILRRLGYKVHMVTGGCCGALHAHSGELNQARSKALKLASKIPAEMQILVNSAGCGSTMKEYEFLDPNLKQVADRVQDVTEFIIKNGALELLQKSPGITVTATYHDACHLAHGQKITQEPRELLKAINGLRYSELAEADMCCGSAGIYNIVQPAKARTLLDRKWENILATGASVVATGNPGCLAWIQQAAQESGRNISVWHTLDIIEAAFCGELPLIQK